MLLAEQIRRKISIFACDAAAVYTNMTIRIDIGNVTKPFWSTKVDTDLHCELGGPFHTLMNTPVFVKLWRQVINDGIFRNHDWTAKVDPDAVFLPARLRTLLRSPDLQDPQAGMGTFLNNCGFGMHGPVEVVTRRSLEVYATGAQTCKLPPQEDVYLQACLLSLKVKQVDHFDLLSEDHCAAKDWRECKTNNVAFHPFKSVAEYTRCIGIAECAAVLEGYELPASDITVVENVPSAGGCCAECTPARGCGSWSWETGGGSGRCHLKTLGGALWRRKAWGFVSGVARDNVLHVRIRNKDGLCMDAGGKLVHLWTCSDSPTSNQVFAFSIKNGTLESFTQGRCLDYTPDGPGGKIGLQPCQGLQSQAWESRGNPGNLASGSNVCLDAPWRNKTGSVMEVWQCDSTSERQQWMLEIVPQWGGEPADVHTVAAP